MQTRRPLRQAFSVLAIQWVRTLVPVGSRNAAGDGTSKSGCGCDRVVTAESALRAQAVYKPRDDGLSAESADSAIQDP